MQKHTRSKCHRFAAVVFLIGIFVAMAPVGIANAASYLATGHWDFEQGDLRATLGTDLEYGDAPGETAMRDHTSFGTTTSFGIPDIGGQPAKVLKYTRDDFTGIDTDKNPRGYLAQHGMAPNGGGTKVNQFTMIVDLLIPDLHM